MVKQEAFELEQFIDKYETEVKYNVAETCCYSMSLREIENISGNKFDFDKIANERLAYSYIQGSPGLKKAIGGLYETIGPENLVVTNGGIGANFLSFYTLVGPGDHVIVLSPIYQQLSSVPKMFGADVEIIKLKFEDGFQPNLKQLEAKMRKNTKMIVMNNPNNPTGCIFPQETVLKIVDIARKYGSYILSDEVYRPLFHSLEPADSEPKAIADLYERGISTGSMSKSFSVAGIRLGWIASRDKNVIEGSLIRRDFNMISVGVIDDIIAQYVLQNKEAIMKHNYQLCVQNLVILDDVIRRSKGKLEYVRPKAGTTAFVKVNNKDVPSTMQMCLNLAKHDNVLAVPGETFNYPGFLRIGFANRREDLINGLEKILAYLNV